MNKKRWICTINVIVCLSILVYLGALSLLIPPPTQSEVERRELAQKPKFSFAGYFDKTYTKEFDTFYADTFPGREGFIKLSYALDGMKGVSGEVKLYKSNMQEEQSSSVPQPSLSTSSLPPEPSSSSVSQPAASSSSSQSSGESSSSQDPAQSMVPAVDDEAYLNNNIFIYKNAAYQLFYGDNAAAASFANIASSYAAELPGVNVYTQVVPQPFNFYLPYQYRKMGKDEKEYADYYQSQLTNGVRGIKVYDKLEEHKEEYLYFRTDTHWTARGAYCGYLAFCEEAGLTPVPLEQMERRQVPGDFLGYLYTITMDRNLAATPDYVEYFIVPGVEKVEALFDRAGARTLNKLSSLWAEDRRGGNAYSTFIYGDLPYMKIKTSAGTGRSVLLIKDSYGNAFAPYLVSHYDTVHILDERYFPYSVYDLIEQQGIDDVIISQSSYSANAASHQRNLQNIKHGTSGLPLPDYDAPVVEAPPPEEPLQEDETAGQS